MADKKAAPAGKGKPAKKKRTRRERLASIRSAVTFARENDPKGLWIVLAVFLGTFAVFEVIGIIVGHPVYLGFIGLMLAVLLAMIIFARRTQKAAIASVADRPGAAAAVIDTMRGSWRVTPAAAVNPRTQDLVHRVVGRPGVILVVEGPVNRTRELVSSEKKRVARVVGPEVPISEVWVGDGAGQVPLGKLQRHLGKLPKAIKPAVVNQLDARLKAIGAARPPIPKGPVPRSTRAVPRGKMR